MAGRIPRVFINDSAVHALTSSIPDPCPCEAEKAGQEFPRVLSIPQRRKPRPSPLTVRNSFTTALDVARTATRSLPDELRQARVRRTVEELQQCTILKCQLKQAAAQPDRAPSEANALSVDERSEYVLPDIYTTRCHVCAPVSGKTRIKPRGYRRFAIGFAPPGWDNVLKPFGRQSRKSPTID